MITRIHHVQITIPRSGENEARKFYCGILGLSEIAKPRELQERGGLWLRVGDRQVHIGIDDTPNRPVQRAHVAYEVEDLNALRHRLEKANIAVVESMRIPGYARFEVRDPFGNRIEFIQPIQG
jgi:catechol 2,3-dioxygenase-like lactoylglutathione lyase family enzyme